MKRFKYWKLSEGQDTDISSKSPALFFQEDPDRPVTNAPCREPEPGSSRAKDSSSKEKDLVRDLEAGTSG